MPTLAERILSHAAGRAVAAGDVVTLAPDRVLVHDSIAPSVIRLLREELGTTRLAHPERVAVVIDHVAPAANVATATNQKALREWVREQGIRRFFEVGRGICHQVLVEEGLAAPGEVVLGTDSHSTAYGAVAAFGSGLGSTDVAVLLASGRTWLRVPETIRIAVRGRFPAGLGPKDLALEVVRRLGADGATYAALEYAGLEHLGIAGRLTLATMAVEAGAKAGLVAPAGLAREGLSVPGWLADPGDAAHASYARTLEVDLAELVPSVARPGRVDDVVPLAALAPTPVDVVYVGTCTNGRLEDLRAVARVLGGRRVASGVRLIVVPASSRVLAEAVADGTVSALLAAGAVLGPPGCGACIGRHMGALAPGETCVFTGNRNFAGRMGSPEARIFLASPEVAAASAALGRLAGPAEAASFDPTTTDEPLALAAGAPATQETWRQGP